MTRLRIRDYEPQDYLAIQCSVEEMRSRLGQPLARYALFHKLGMAYTAADPDGQLMACGGLHDLWPGVGELWLVVSPLARKYPGILGVFKGILAGWLQWYHRVQATVNPEWPEAMRLAEHFGFQVEARMRRHGPRGEDEMLYALLKED